MNVSNFFLDSPCTVCRHFQPALSRAVDIRDKKCKKSTNLAVLKISGTLLRELLITVMLDGRVILAKHVKSCSGVLEILGGRQQQM